MKTEDKAGYLILAGLLEGLSVFLMEALSAYAIGVVFMFIGFLAIVWVGLKWNQEPSVGTEAPQPLESRSLIQTEKHHSLTEKENPVFYRMIGAVALLLFGSYLFAIAFTGITLLPLTVIAVGVSGNNSIPCAGITPFCTTATLNQLMQIFISELTFGIICLAGSLFVAFFKFEAVIPRPQLPTSPVSIPQLSKPSELTTEQLIAELKQRVPRT